MEHRPQAATMTPPNGHPIVAVPSWLALEPEPDAGSAHLARDYARLLLDGADPPFVDDVLMVVNELVTNAIVHVPEDHALPSGISPLVHLSLLVQLRWVLVGVRDPWPDIPQVRAAGTDDEDGRGLKIVYALTAGCWTHFGTFDKTMYALVLRPGCSLRPGELERLKQP